MKRLLITTTTLPRWPGDTEARFVLDLAKHLQPYFEPLLLAPAAPGAALDGVLEGVSVRRYRYAPLRSWEQLCYPGNTRLRIRKHPLYALLVPGLLYGLQKAVREELKQRTYACVHCHWFLPQGIVQAIFFSRRPDPRFVVTSHGADMYLAEKRLGSLLYRFTTARAASVSAVSPGIAADLRQALGATAPEIIPVIPMGVNLEHFSRRHYDPEWPPFRQLDRPIILFVGRMVEKKGVAYLLEALASEPLRSTTATLAIVGDGPMHHQLEQLTNFLGIAHRVRFLGALPHERLQTAFASSDIACVPSVPSPDGDREGVPTVLCEAAASSLPAVASDVGGISLVVLDGTTGKLVPAANAQVLASALHSLVVDVALRERLGRQARRHVEHFSWPMIARQYADWINTVIDTNPGSAPG